ncbi:hypothetical protein AN964_22110 [Heyndrickxia shackletonii]|uniref:WD40 repeat protein n=1 Tax=Heyndrickxia shackletonii TaxID=157838 RepID=A0A0Q3WRG4_9BACI|nr:PD40 domain-containing protein [Heyndrickxia shackletonii]KQL50367.1 hypothetical protein AN964_22110 [Heyndrickxia shackletonii]NEZ00822.1 hypothetical protein [Heyndrickxia shackletonii]
MSYSSKTDSLSEYIDAINNTQNYSHNHEEDMDELFDTVNQIKRLQEVELPSDDFIESVALKIRSIEQPMPLRKKVNKWGLSRWFPLAATLLLIIGIVWQQFSHSFVSANEISVVNTKELIPLGQNEVENPSYIHNHSLIGFGNNEKIWIWNPKTNEKKAFSIGSFLYMRDPAWSPDDSMIAFSGYKNETAGIWKMHKDGSNIQKVIIPSNRNENDDTPAWSPDGKQLAFTKTVTKPRSPHGFDISKQEIWIINQDGTNAKKLTNGKDPSWSPDGKMLSFTKNNDEVWTIAVDGSAAKKLTNGMESSWSPDGQFIVYSKYDKITEKINSLATIQTSLREIWAIHVNTHKRSQLTKGKIDEAQLAVWRKEVKANPPKTPIQYVSSGLYSDWQPNWSKDGKSIVFSRNTQQETGNHFSLYQMDLQFK